MKRSQKNKLNSYVKYSNLALQMLVIIGLGTFGGYLLDNYLNWGFPLFVVLFSVLSVVVAIYTAVKDLIK
jgi:F0F1-type ATP synthase assembly protein I